MVVLRVSLSALPFGFKDKCAFFEVSALHLTVNTGRINFMTIYQLPHLAEFLDEFHNLLSQVTPMPGCLFICGDMNCSSSIGDIDKQQQIIDDSLNRRTSRSRTPTWKTYLIFNNPRRIQCLIQSVKPSNREISMTSTLIYNTQDWSSWWRLISSTILNDRMWMICHGSFGKVWPAFLTSSHLCGT